MPAPRSTPWKPLVALGLILACVTSCVPDTPGPEACAGMRPIDLTAAGWAALEAADPQGAQVIDAQNLWWEEHCR